MANEREEYGGTKELLNLQLSEIDILQAMFTEEKELYVDRSSMAEIQDYLSGSTDIEPKRVAFSLKLFLSDNFRGQYSNEDYLEVDCCLPQRYPQEIPDVFVKSSSLTREIQRELNESKAEFLSSLERGELCVVTIIQWLQETWPECYVRSTQQMNCKKVEVDGTAKKDTSSDEDLSRMWLYMHHIYSKTKRKHILDWADESKLTGFSLPGKPGVVCIEGKARDTEEYFSRLRRLNWKKITCRHKERGVRQRKFEDFKELVFHVHGAGDDRMNMGEFFQFLLKRDLGEMFKLLFGIEGKSNSVS